MATLATVEDVRNLDYGDSILGVDDGTIQCILDEEVDQFFGTLWGSGDKRRRGEALLAAHIAFRSRKIYGPAGPVTSSGAGGLTRSFAWTGGQHDSELASTDFGRRYLRLRSTLGASMAVLC